MQQHRPPIVFAVVIVAVVIASDQLVKAAVAGWIGRGATTHTRWFVGDWFGLAYAENRGVAFGLLRGQASAALLAVAVGILSALGAFLYAWRHKRIVEIGGGLVIGGALGNIIDRARLGYVRDFVAVGPWPSFNVADAAITCGMIMMALAVTFGEARSANRGTVSSRAGARVTETAE